MSASHSLYKSKSRLQTATEVQLANSKLQRQKNTLKVKLAQKEINIRVYRAQMASQSKFNQILREQYTETYEKIKKTFIETYGKTPRNKDRRRAELLKIKAQLNGKFLFPRLCSAFKIKMEDEE